MKVLTDEGLNIYDQEIKQYIKDNNNVSDLVPNTRKIAGIDLTDDITSDELVSALNISGGSDYVHPDSGVTEGTYRSVTVDKQGHVTSGSNPTVTIAQGGTGATTAKGAQYNLLKDMNELTTEVTDASLMVFSYSDTGMSATNGVILKKKASLFWDYIKSKISSALGLTETNYAGTSAKATADANGNIITETYATKDEIGTGGGSDVSAILNTLGYTIKTKKNLLKYTAISKEANGITFVVNSNDKSITANGTAISTSNAAFDIAGGNRSAEISLPDWLEVGKSYIISDGVGNTDNTKPRFFIHFYRADGTGVQYFNQEFTVTAEDLYYRIRVLIPQGATVENLTFYPMIRSADITDDTYEPNFDDIHTRLNNLAVYYQTIEPTTVSQGSVWIG